MIPVTNGAPVTSRIASAAGAILVNSVILLALGLGFPPPASAEAAQTSFSAATGASVTKPPLMAQANFAPTVRLAQASSPGR